MLALYTNRSYFIHLLLATVTTLTIGLAPTVNAQETTYDASFSSSVKEAIPINVLVGQSRVINFDRPIGRFSISNPEIAEAVMVRPDQVLVNGKAFGQVNFIAWEKSDSKFIVFDVFVRANLSLNRFANPGSVSTRRHPSEPGQRFGRAFRHRYRSAGGDAGR